MKLKYPLLLAILLLSANLTAVYGQDENKRPKYITVTTMHWNMEQENFSMDEWKKTEKEFLDKVTMKNEHIMSVSVFLHQFTPDNTELLYVQAFESWDAIEKASDRNGELIEAAWPDEAAREAYFKKRNHYYANEHSDEIYATVEGAILREANPGEDLTLYVRKSYLAFPEDGSFEEWKSINDQYLEKVLKKNKHIKGYYPNMHYYGADRTEFVEAFYVDDVAALDRMLDELDVLAKNAWSEEERKEMGKKMSKYFTGKHGDFIYTLVSDLTK